MIAPKAHYRLSPSSSSRWLICPASAPADLPEEPPGEAAIRGTAAHETAAFALTHGLPLFGNDWENQMVRPYVNYVSALEGDRIHEEQLVSTIVDDYGGTLDTIAVTDDALHVVDLKTGKYRVPAAGNTQLKCYLTLAREHFPGRSTFQATIIQPQVWKRPQTAEFTTEDLDAHLAAVIIASASKRVVPNPGCRFCPLKRDCGPGQEYNRENYDPYRTA